MKTIPYTYKLIFKPSNQYYYGVRWGKGCHPNDLWVKYFSSSKHIHKLIKEYGLGSFDYKIMKTFTNREEATEHERSLLERVNASKNGNFINKVNNMPDYTRKGLKTIHHEKLDIETYHDPKLPLPDGWKYGFSKGHIKTMSVIRKGKPSHNKGKKGKPTGPCTNKRKENIRKSRLNTKKLECPHCNKEYDPGNFKRFHGDKCKLNPNIDPEILEKRSKMAKHSMKVQKERGNYSPPKLPKGEFKCPHCEKVGVNYGSMMRHHFHRCQYKTK